MFDGRLFRRHRLPKRTEAWTQGALVSAFLRTKTLYTRSHLCVNASARLREMSHARVLPNACLCLCEPRAPCRVTHIRAHVSADLLPKRTQAWTQGALVSAFLRTKTLYTRSHLCVNASARLREMSHARVLPNACLCLCEPRAPCRFTHIRVRAHACLRHKDKKFRAATESNVCSSF